MDPLIVALSLVGAVSFVLVALRFWRERRDTEASLAVLLTGVSVAQLGQAVVYPPDIDTARFLGTTLRMFLCLAGVLFLLRRPA